MIESVRLQVLTAMRDRLPQPAMLRLERGLAGPALLAAVEGAERRGVLVSVNGILKTSWADRPDLEAVVDNLGLYDGVVADLHRAAGVHYDRKGTRT